MKSARLIKVLLESELKDKRKVLKKMIGDEHSTVEMHDKVLEKCKELEYAIKEVERKYNV